MPAIPVHHTPTSTGAWDGPANEARLRNDEVAAYYRKAFAWVDPDKDPDTKAAYKFIHHEVAADGTVGPANVRACQTGIGVLNGGRGGADIPSGDRRGVYNHLAAHLRDADVEPAPLRGGRPAIEYRTYPLAELRVEQLEGQQPRIVGHAAVFDRRSEVLMQIGSERLVEEIAPGAFAKTIREADIRALINHDPNLVLGRNRAGTLSLAEDDRGLAVTIEPPDTQAARDLIALMRRGDVNQMSFAFQPVKQVWAEEVDEATGMTTHVRRLQEVRLFDVSIVTFPAYPDTDAQVRALAISAGDDAPAILRDYAEPGQEPHSVADMPEPGQEVHSAPLSILKMKLELKEKEL